MKRVGWSLLHDALEIRDTGRYGMGVFATRLISPGEILCVMGGQVADTSLENAASPLSTRYNIDFSEECSFCPLEESQVPLMPQFLFNHSCRPNTGFADSQTMVAIETISGGGKVAMTMPSACGRAKKASATFQCPANVVNRNAGGSYGRATGRARKSRNNTDNGLCRFFKPSSQDQTVARREP